MRATRVEDDAHRVLQLIRAQPQGRVRSGAARRAAAASRHRHERTEPKSTDRKSLVHAKTRALLAVYGLRDTVQVAAKSKEEAADEFERISDEKRRELLEARRLIYRNHFSGLQATYGPTGRPKLETLIDAAVEAKRRSSKHSPLAIGAAVLTSHNRIFSSGRLEGAAHDPRFDVCAERVALLKLLEHQSTTGQIEVVEAMVICSDQRGLLPVPCGSCREFLAEFGDFPVFLLNAENDSQETRSFQLFPHARHSTHTAMALSSAADAKQPAMEKHETRLNDRPTDVRDWSCEQVAQWLTDVVELPQYRDMFTEKRVDGATLWHVGDSDLQLLLGIVHPLHRRRLVTHIDRLKDHELLEHGVDYGQLSDYLAVLDRDRLEVVAQLKATFDRLDVNADGLLDFAELKHAMKTLGLTPSAQAVEQLVQQYSGGEHGVTFPVFVQAFSQLGQLPVGELRDAAGAEGVPTVDLSSLRETFDRADANRSGSVDEQELVELLRSLGRDRCVERAKEWLEAVDLDGDRRISFAEFFLRYAQLTKLDMTRLRTLFEDGEGAVARRRPTRALLSALLSLFPHENAADVSAWCARRPWVDAAEGKGEASRSEALSFAEFALAVVMYAEALRLRVAQLKMMQQALSHNDALCHRSRIVHLQQSGHVRLCRHPGGDAEEKTQSLGEKRRVETKTAREEKDGDATDDSEGEEGRRVEKVFMRFADGRRRVKGNQRRHNGDAKGRDTDEEEEEEEEEERRLNAVEAAQALVELGVACSKDQLVRYLDREGFGLRRTIEKRELERIYRRLKVFQVMPAKRGGGKAEAERVKEMWAAMRCGEPDREEKDQPGSRGRREYDAYLREKHAMSKKMRQKAEQERQRLARELRGRERSRKSEMDRARRRRRSTSDESTTSCDSDRRRAQRRPTGSGRSASRGRRRRSSSSTSTTSTSTASSESTTERRRARSHSRGRRERCFRGFEIGDRVTSSSRGAGTIVRIYRDYFVADVHFDSGERVKNVGLSHLKRMSEAERTAARAREKEKREALVLGASVRVAHKGTKASRRATILRCRTNGTYDVVANECGERELLSRVSLAEISLEKKPVVYSEGQKVTVKRRHEYLRGRVTLCRTNGTYDVRVGRSSKTEVLRGVAWGVLAPDEEESDEEEEEEGEEEEEKRETRRRDAQRRQEAEEDGKQEDEEEELTAGDRVEARFQGQSAYYVGRIARVHRDGSCDVEYDDGDAECRVPRRLIRRAAAISSRVKEAAGEYDDDFE